MEKKHSVMKVQIQTLQAVFMLTLLSAAASPLFWRVLPVVQLHAEGASQRRGGLWVGNLHNIDMTVCGAEITAV